MTSAIGTVGRLVGREGEDRTVKKKEKKKAKKVKKFVCVCRSQKTKEEGVKRKKGRKEGGGKEVQEGRGRGEG